MLQMCPWSYHRKNKYLYKFKYLVGLGPEKYIKCYTNYVRIFIHIRFFIFLIFQFFDTVETPVVNNIRTKVNYNLY